MDPIRDVTGPRVKPATVRALVLDESDEMVDLLTFVLRRAGFDVVAATDLAAAARIMAGTLVHLVIYDPETLQRAGSDLPALRALTDVPVVAFARSSDEGAMLRALDTGADDYVVKRFSHHELIARARAVLRRQALAPTAQLVVGEVTLDTALHEVRVRDEVVHLTSTEFRLLELLMVNAGRVVPTETLLSQVWGRQYTTGGAVVRTVLHSLRKKLGMTGENTAIHTVPGTGIIMRPPSSLVTPLGDE